MNSRKSKLLRKIAGIHVRHLDVMYKPTNRLKVQTLTSEGGLGFKELDLPCMWSYPEGSFRQQLKEIKAQLKDKDIAFLQQVLEFNKTILRAVEQEDCSHD